VNGRCLPVSLSCAPMTLGAASDCASLEAFDSTNVT
jgi:hypothetical protein